MDHADGAANPLSVQRRNGSATRTKHLLHLVVTALHQRDADERGEGLGISGISVGAGHAPQHLERRGPAAAAISEYHPLSKLLSRSRAQPQLRSIGAEVGEVGFL